MPPRGCHGLMHQHRLLFRWLSVRLETLGALAALAAAVLAVEQRGEASVFGLVLSYALQITVLTSITVSLVFRSLCPAWLQRKGWLTCASATSYPTAIAASAGKVTCRTKWSSAARAQS